MDQNMQKNGTIHTPFNLRFTSHMVVGAALGMTQGLPREFCRNSMPRCDEMITLVDEEGDEYPTVWLARKDGLSGGWRGFAVTHGLVDGDVVVFQVIKHGVLKVYIIRANDKSSKET
ncbi:hypothetical protein Dimus_034192 [Dionaea muscipula]